MTSRMSCDCGWSGEVADDPRPRCPACHAPLAIPPLAPLGDLGPAPAEEPSAAVRLARRRRQARELDEDEPSPATAEADEPLDDEDDEAAGGRRQRYRPQLLLRR